MSEMVAWPGEKLDLYDAVVLGGSKDPYDDIWYQLRGTEDPDTTVTLVAGDDFYLYSQQARLLRDSDPIGACTWIVDAVAGGAVEVSTSIDPDWDYGGGYDWTPAASSLTAGRNLIPLPAPYRTFDVLAGNAGGLLIRFTVTSGTVVLSSVGLQVEPPDGLKVRTGWEWSDYMTPGLVPARGDIGLGYAGTGYGEPYILDIDAALDAARSGAGNQAPSAAPTGTPPNSYFRLGPENGADFSASFETFAYDRAGSINISPPSSFAYLMVGYSYGYWRERPELRRTPLEFFSADPPLLGRDYERVGPGFDWTTYGEFADGDTAAIEWEPVDVYPFYQPSPGVPEGLIVGATIGIANETLLSDTGGGWTGSFAGWPPPLGTATTEHVLPSDGGAVVHLGTPAPGTDFTVTIHTDLADAGFYPGLTNPGDDTAWHQWLARPNVFIRYQMPDFRYRVPVFAPDPDAVTTTSPRFYVKNLDETMRPVGDGKPASELSVFRVPTAQGWFRDLTTAEYAVYGTSVRPPDGFPLKVKRLDSAGEVWWDQVGWMVPDDS